MTDKDRLDFLEKFPKIIRYCASVTMCGKYPCWQTYTQTEGRITRKTLREAVDAAAEGVSWRDIE